MEKVFVEGMIVKEAKPDFVLCKLSIKVDEFAAFMNATRISSRSTTALTLTT